MQFTPENIVAMAVGASAGPCVKQAAAAAGFSTGTASVLGSVTTGVVTSAVRGGLENSKDEATTSSEGVATSAEARVSEAESTGSASSERASTVNLAPAIIKTRGRFGCTIACVEDTHIIDQGYVPEARASVQVTSQTRGRGMLSQAAIAAPCVPSLGSSLSNTGSSGLLAYAFSGGMILWGVDTYIRYLWDLNSTKKK